MLDDRIVEKALKEGYSFMQSSKDKNQFFLVVDLSHPHETVNALGDCLIVDCLEGVKSKMAEAE